MREADSAASVVLIDLSCEDRETLLLRQCRAGLLAPARLEPGAGATKRTAKDAALGCSSYRRSAPFANEQAKRELIHFRHELTRSRRAAEARGQRARRRVLPRRLEVRAGGLEPPCQRRGHLKTVCIPISPRSRGANV